MLWCVTEEPASTYLRAVLDATLKHLCDSRRGAVRALQLRKRLIQRLLAREHAHCMLQDGPCSLHAAPVQGFLNTPHKGI